MKIIYCAKHIVTIFYFWPNTIRLARHPFALKASRARRINVVHTPPAVQETGRARRILRSDGYYGLSSSPAVTRSVARYIWLKNCTIFFFFSYLFQYFVSVVLGPFSDSCRPRPPRIRHRVAPTSKYSIIYVDYHRRSPLKKKKKTVRWKIKVTRISVDVLNWEKQKKYWERRYIIMLARNLNNQRDIWPRRFVQSWVGWSRDDGGNTEESPPHVAK